MGDAREPLYLRFPFIELQDVAPESVDPGCKVIARAFRRRGWIANPNIVFSMVISWASPLDGESSFDQPHPLPS